MAMVHPPYWLSVNGDNTKIFADDNSGSTTCYREVVVDDCYNLLKYAQSHKPSTIVDIGANIGVFSKFCTLLFPSASIYAYEPNPIALKWLNHNAHNTHIQVFPCAVGNQSGAVALKTNCDSTIGYLSLDGDLSVQCIPSFEVAENLSIDLLKMDCEGGEWSILQDPNLLERTKNFCLEYHLYDNHSLQELTELIEKANHQVILIQPNEGHDGKFGLLWSKHKFKI